MIESAAERELVGQVAAVGGLCLKWPATANAGVPDRIVIINGRVIFVELKRQGATLRPIQHYMHAKLKAAGAEVRTLYGIDDVKKLVEDIRNTIGVEHGRRD